MRYKYKPGHGSLNFDKGLDILKENVTNNVFKGWPKITLSKGENKIWQ